MYLKRIISSLNGLYFEFEGAKYYKLSDLMNQINGNIEANQLKSIDIEWCWDYQGNDDKDTLEGTLASSYSFDISLISVKLQ